MFYSRRTAAIAAILTVLALAVLQVCSPRPYSGNVWLEAAMLVVGGIVLGCISVGIRHKTDSSLPVSIAAVGVTFRYFLFVVVMSVPPIFSFDVKFRYYALVHGIGLGIWMIHLLILQMGAHSVDEQDGEMANMLEMRRTCHLKLAGVIDRMRKSGMADGTLLKDLERLNERFRLGFGKGVGLVDADSRIRRLLDSLDAAASSKDESEIRRVADELQLQFDGRERAARM